MKRVLLLTSIALTTTAIVAATGDNWQSNTTYEKGDTVCWQHNRFVANWQNWNEVPDNRGEHRLWEQTDLDSSAPFWHSEYIYNENDVVMFKGRCYRANWWNKNQFPGKSGNQSAWRWVAHTGDQKTVLTPQLRGEYTVGIKHYYFNNYQFPKHVNEAARKIHMMLYYPSGDDSGLEEPLLSKALLAYSNSILQDYLPGLNLDCILAGRSNSSLYASAAQGSFPVLLFSPGMGGQPEIYRALLEEICSRGYIVAAVNHRYGSGFSAYNDGEIVTVDPNEFLLGLSDKEDFMERYIEGARKMFAMMVSDVHFVHKKLYDINRYDQQIGGHMDLESMGILGHSLGGATAIKSICEDNRFQAVVNIDGSMEVWGASAEEFSAPLLMIQTDPEDTAFGAETKRFLDKSGDAYQMTVNNIAHQAISTDYPHYLKWLSTMTGDKVLKPETSATTEAMDADFLMKILTDYITAFFDTQLKEEYSELLQTDTSYVDIEYSVYRN